MIDAVPDHPNIWSDDSGEQMPHLDVEVAGALVFTHALAHLFDNHEWGHAQDPQFEASSHIVVSVPGPMQTFQRAEYWMGLFLLSKRSLVFLQGSTTLMYSEHLPDWLDKGDKGVPLSLVTDG